VTIPFIGTASSAALPTLEPWDTMKVADFFLPGYVRVSGSGLSHDFQTRKTPGRDGSRTTDLGRETAKFNVTLVIGSPQDWDRFCDIITLGKLQPTQVSKATSKPELQAVAVVHPAINALGVTAAKVKRIGVPHPGIVGTVEIEMEFWEHLAPTDMQGAGTATSTKKDVVTLEPGGGAPPTVAPPKP
jgi:hypothetical protein